MAYWEIAGFAARLSIFGDFAVDQREYMRMPIQNVTKDALLRLSQIPETELQG